MLPASTNLLETPSDEAPRADDASGRAAGAARPRLRGGFAWSLTGNLVYAACQWGMLVTLARVLPPASVGQFALALAVSAPVFILAQLKLRGVLATDHAGTSKFEHYLGLRVVTTAIAFAAVAVIALVLRMSQPMTALLLLVAAIRAIDGIADIFHGYLQRQERMDLIAHAMSINGVVSLLAFASLLVVTTDLHVATLGSGLGSLASLIFTLRRAGHAGAASGGGDSVTLRPSYDRRRMVSLAGIALPAGLATALGTLAANTPRYVIGDQLGSAALGVFAALSYVLVAGSLVIPALGQAAIPRLSRYFADRRLDDFRQLLMRLIVAGTVLGAVSIIVVAVAGRLLLLLVYGATYADHQQVLLLLTVANAVTSAFIFVGTALASTRHFRLQVPVMIGALSALFISLWLLVPRLGLIGAAYALIIAALCEGLGNAIYLVRVLRRASSQVVSATPTSGGGATDRRV